MALAATYDEYDRSPEFLAKEQELEKVKKDYPSFLLYLPVMMVALLKDLLDLAIGWIPGVGFLLAVCFGFLLFMLLFIIRANKSLINSRFLIKMGMVFLVGTLIESIPLLNFLPIETTVIYVIYWLDKHLSEKQIKLLMEALHLMK